MNMDWFSISFLMEPLPEGDFLVAFPLLGFFVLATFAGSFLRQKARHNKYLKKSIRKRFGKFIFLGVIGLFLVASRLALIPYFSMRLWLIIITTLTLVLGLFTMIKVRKDYKKRQASARREEQTR